MNNYSSSRKVRAGIAGFHGYSGAELVEILARHPHVEPVLLEHREADERPVPIGRGGPERLPCTPEAILQAGLAVVFLATPVEVSMHHAGPMLDAGAKVLDAIKIGDDSRIGANAVVV